MTFYHSDDPSAIQEIWLWQARAHLDTAPGARPSGRFNVRVEVDETLGLSGNER
jgi:hypothetical protein